MSKMSKVVSTVAVVAIATVIGRGVGYFTGSRMAASNQAVESSSSVAETTDSASASSDVSEAANTTAESAASTELAAVDSTSAANSVDSASDSTAAANSTDSASESAAVTEPADSASSDSATAADSTDSTAASDSSTETTAQTPAPDSHLIGHRVFQTDESTEHPEYIVIFYDTGSKKLVQLADETIFYKSAGYTSESVESVDVSQVYPGAENMDFMSKEVTEETDYIRLGVYFNNLEKNENLKALHNAGIIVLDDNFGENDYVNAESLCQSMLNNGKTELDVTKMPSNLNYAVNQ